MLCFGSVHSKRVAGAFFVSVDSKEDSAKWPFEGQCKERRREEDGKNCEGRQKSDVKVCPVYREV